MEKKKKRCGKIMPCPNSISYVVKSRLPQLPSPREREKSRIVIRGEVVILFRVQNVSWAAVAREEIGKLVACQ